MAETRLSYLDHVSRSYLAGWAADTAQPQASLKLIIEINGRRVGSTQANLEGQDLLGLFPGATGRYRFRYNFEIPLSQFENHQVQVRFADSGELLTQGEQLIARCTPATPGSERPPQDVAKLRPILVTSTGRSGSSMFMARLAQHPEIVVGGPHPHEILQLSYYASALRVLSSEADRERSTRPELLLSKDSRFSIGFNPFNDRFGTPPPALTHYWQQTVPRRLAASFNRLIREYYEIIAAAQFKPAPQYFAEKGLPDKQLMDASRFMFGRVREIVLIRDPRDLMCSYRAFWNTEAALALNTIEAHTRYLLKLREQRRPDSLFLRYEDLLREPAEAMARVYAFLELEPTLFAAEPSAEVIPQGHATSQSPLASIGRWRRELSATQIADCNQRFAAFCAAFDYAD